MKKGRLGTPVIALVQPGMSIYWLLAAIQSTGGWCHMKVRTGHKVRNNRQAALFPLSLSLSVCQQPPQTNGGPCFATLRYFPYFLSLSLATFSSHHFHSFYYYFTFLVHFRCFFSHLIGFYFPEVLPEKLLVSICFRIISIILHSTSVISIHSCHSLSYNYCLLYNQ